MQPMQPDAHAAPDARSSDLDDRDPQMSVAKSVSAPHMPRADVADAPAGTDADAKGNNNVATAGAGGGGFFSRITSLFSVKRREVSLGQENAFYYNEELKKWVERGKEHEAAAAMNVPPPPSDAVLNSSKSASIPPPTPPCTPVPDAPPSAGQPSAGPPSVGQPPAPTASSAAPPGGPPPAGRNKYTAGGRRRGYVDTLNANAIVGAPAAAPTPARTPPAFTMFQPKANGTPGTADEPGQGQ